MIGTVQAQQKAPAGFHIEGHVKGLEEQSIVTLTDANKPTDTLAHSKVKGGAFILTGHVKEPNLVILNFNSAKKKTSLFIGNESVMANGDIENLSAMEIRGSQSEQDFQALEMIFNPYFSQLNQISQFANSPEGASKRDSIGNVYQAVAMSIQIQVDSFILQ